MRKRPNMILKMFKKKTIVFVSFHKCATSFFSTYILKKVNGLEHINYAGDLYNNEKNVHGKLETKTKIYGVIRILDSEHPSFEFISKFLSHPNMSKVNIIFWIRDPRDILVSMYYSFGFSHGLSNNILIKRYQEERRKKIQKMTLDEYVLHESKKIKQKFEIMKSLIERHDNHILLSYEEMINDFDSFFAKLSKVVSIGETEKEKIFKETRPSKEENVNQHKRKGSVGTYKEKLKNETVIELNNELLPILEYFNYGKEV